MPEGRGGSSDTSPKKKTDLCLSSCDARYNCCNLDILKKGDTTPKSGHQHLPNDSRVTLPRSVLKERYTLISPGLLLITNECFPGRKSSFIQYFLSGFSSFSNKPVVFNKNHAEILHQVYTMDASGCAPKGWF